MTVWDCFPYWKERWAAEARLSLWAQFRPDVEYVPVAFLGDRTHRGTPLPPDLPPVPDGVETMTVELDSGTDWGREQQQRDAVYMLKTSMDPDDLVLLCDADEIVDPRQLDAILDATATGPVKLAMDLYYYGTRYRQPWPWTHGAACRARDLPSYPSAALRLVSRFPVVPNAGWHVSWLGGAEAIGAKTAAFAHAEFDTPDARSAVIGFAEQGLDVHGRTLFDDPMTGPLADFLTAMDDLPSPRQTAMPTAEMANGAGQPVVALHPEAAAVLACLTDPQWSVLEIGPGGNPTPWSGPYASVDHTPPGETGTAGSQAGVLSAATHHGDMDRLPFPAAQFDALVARHVLEHHHDTLSVLREWRRVLRRGGRLVVVAPDQHLYPGNTVQMDPTHRAAFTPDQLVALASHAGFVDAGAAPCVPQWSFILTAEVA